MVENDRTHHSVSLFVEQPSLSEPPHISNDDIDVLKRKSKLLETQESFQQFENISSQEMKRQKIIHDQNYTLRDEDCPSENRTLIHLTENSSTHNSFSQAFNRLQSSISNPNPETLISYSTESISISSSVISLLEDDTEIW